MTIIDYILSFLQSLNLFCFPPNWIRKQRVVGNKCMCIKNRMHVSKPKISFCKLLLVTFVCLSVSEIHVWWFTLAGIFANRQGRSRSHYCGGVFRRRRRHRAIRKLPSLAQQETKTLVGVVSCSSLSSMPSFSSVSVYWRSLSNNSGGKTRIRRNLQSLSPRTGR